MTRVLTIDQGNTTAKIKILEGYDTVYSDRVVSPDIEMLASLVSQWNVVAAVYSSVGSLDARMAESLRHMLGGRLLVLTHDTPLPVEVDYGTPGTLGTDRVAAVCGAAALSGGRCALVADAGTCLTLDLLDSRPAFCGGDIAPGLAMRLSAMHAMTHSLPEVGVAGPVPGFGRDTETAMRCGAVHGMAAQIEYAMEKAKRLLGADRMFITGGDAAFILPHLDTKTYNIIHCPDLNAVGLISILIYNEYI